MIEFSSIPFRETLDPLPGFETSKIDVQQNISPTNLQRVSSPISRSTMNYSTMQPIGIWYTPMQRQYNYQEPQQKSYWWLWLFPIVGVLIFIYYYKKEEIDAYFIKTFKSFFPLEIKEELVLE